MPEDDTRHLGEYLNMGGARPQWRISLIVWDNTCPSEMEWCLVLAEDTDEAWDAAVEALAAYYGVEEGNIEWMETDDSWDILDNPNISDGLEQIAEGVWL